MVDILDSFMIFLHINLLKINHTTTTLFIIGSYHSFLKKVNNEWYFFSDEANALEIFNYTIELLNKPSDTLNENNFKIEKIFNRAGLK